MKRFLCLLQQDVRFFVFLELVLMVFRVVFLFLFRGQLGVVPTGEVWYALFLGLRISLKTTALLTSLSFLLATLTGTFRPSWPAAKVRLAVNGLILSVLTFLFMVRIPYYGIFHETFSMMLVNGLKDDAAAILDTAVREYDLFPRLAGVILLAAAPARLDGGRPLPAAGLCHLLPVRRGFPVRRRRPLGKRLPHSLETAERGGPR